LEVALLGDIAWLRVAMFGSDELETLTVSTETKKGKNFEHTITNMKVNARILKSNS
jgi:hypothetical protein